MERQREIVRKCPLRQRVSGFKMASERPKEGCMSKFRVNLEVPRQRGLLP